MPEIDGLRFLATFLVVVVLHFGNFMRECQALQDYDPQNFFHRFLMEGAYGVPIFFAISGFILSLPFAKSRLPGGKPLQLHNYYLRRLSRIEPPYIVAMAVYFVLKVWILHYKSFSELLPHFLASITYTHNVVYGYSSEVMGIAWSLEVEAQFYLLAPIIARLLFIPHLVLRQVLLLVLIVVGAAFSYRWHEISGASTLLDQGCYFLIGILLADWWLHSDKRLEKSKLVAWLGGALFLVSLCLPAYGYNMYLCAIKALLTLVFLHIFISNFYIKELLSKKVLTLIGGMCYSIYLVHMGVFGLLRHRFFFAKFTGIQGIDIALHAVIAIGLVLVVSGLFYVLVERPTMKPKWYEKLFIAKNHSTNKVQPLG